MTVPNEADTTTRPAAVYRLYDAAGTLLYIGSAYDPEKRCKRHRDKPWWPEVARREDEWLEHRGDAYRAEMKAIARERAKYNEMGTSEYTTPQTEAVIRRNAEGLVRGRVQSESWEAYRRAWDQCRATGGSNREASDAAQRARFAHIEASGLFPAWIERRKEHGTL